LQEEFKNHLPKYSRAKNELLGLLERINLAWERLLLQIAQENFLSPFPPKLNPKLIPSHLPKKFPS